MVAGEEIGAGALDAQSVTYSRMTRQVPRRALGTTLPIFACLTALMTSHTVFHRAMEVLSHPTRFTLTIGIGIEPLLACLTGRRISTLLTVGRTGGTLLLLGEILLRSAFVAPFLV